MKIRLFVTKEAALKAGEDKHGYAVVEVPAADLTEAQREELSKHSYCRGENSPEADFYLDSTGDTKGNELCRQFSTADAANVPVILDGLIALKASRVRREADEERQAREKVRSDTQAVLDDRETRSYCKNVRFSDGKWIVDDYSGGTSVRVQLLRPNWPRPYQYPYPDEVKSVSESDEAQAWKAELDKQNEVIIEDGKRFVLEQIEEEKKEEAERLAKAKRRANQIRDWVRDHGTANQQQRFAEKLLPESEVIDAIRAEAFSAVPDDWERYRKITMAEVCTCEYDCDCRLSCSTEDNQPLTENEYERLCDMRRLLPNATVTPVLHECETDECEESLARQSLRVEITVGELYFTRHYAL